MKKLLLFLIILSVFVISLPVLACDKDENCVVDLPLPGDAGGIEAPGPPGGTADQVRVCIKCPGDEEGFCAKKGEKVICPVGPVSPEAFVGDVADYLFIIGLILAPLFIVIGGFIFMTSAGDMSRSTLGKKIILWTIIGFVIILLSKITTSIVVDLLTDDVQIETEEE